MRNAILSLLASLPIVIGTAQADVCQQSRWTIDPRDLRIKPAASGYLGYVPLDLIYFMKNVVKQKCAVNLTKYLFFANSNFIASQKVDPYYLFSIYNRETVRVAVREADVEHYREDEVLRPGYYRLIGYQRFTSNGFPIDVPVIEPVK